MKYQKLEGICAKAIKNNLCTGCNRLEDINFKRVRKMQICKRANRTNKRDFRNTGEDENMSINSKQKGKKGELYVVNKFKEYGYECNRTAQFKGNTGRADDIEGIDYIHCEVKFVEKLNLENAMSQAIRDSLASNREAMPTVFHKKKYQELLVTMRFEDWIKLYNEYYSSMKLKEME